MKHGNTKWVTYAEEDFVSSMSDCGGIYGMKARMLSWIYPLEESVRFCTAKEGLQIDQTSTSSVL